MKNNILRFYVNLLITLLFIGVISCNDYVEPPTIYNPDNKFTTSPVITSILPADSAIGGVREIIINGNNFAVNGIDTNWVKIGGINAEIKSVTENEIVVYRPSSFGKGLNIIVVIPSALSVASVENYIIEEPIIEHGDFSTDSYSLFSMETDLEDNLYIGTRREIQKLSADGIFLSTIGEYPSAFAKITDLKFGPGGFLYAAISKKEIYKIDISTGVETEYIALSSTSEKIDFDSNGNLFAARRNGIYVIEPNLTITETLLYDGNTINELRVLNDYLYVALDGTLTRNKILDAQGKLGATEDILDLTSMPEFSVAQLSSFNMDEDGRIILAIKNHVTHSLFVLENNGSITPFYYADIIPMAVDQIVYGNDRFMYLNRGSLVKDSVRVSKWEWIN
ncbi:MAG: IPT/TIG domain-containing protein [Ignavibacteriales bacterium]|nr:IPT/TIG domain-containing protein [Ignavibacteriales bacterium]